MGVLIPRLFWIVLVFLFSSSAAAAPVSVPAPASGLSGQVGIAAAVRGSVKMNSQGQIGKIVESGAPIFLGDEISTGGEGSLQILLLDQTIFTIGPNSSIVIDKFIYDPTDDSGEIKAKVVKGVFRFVTGKIARKEPSQMEVELPTGTIGIRGTIVAGETVGKKSTVVLLGPGENNNTQHRQGRFTLFGESEGQESVVGKSGFGATIDESGVPSAPFQVPEIDLQRLTQSLGPVTPDAGPQGGPDAGGPEGPGQDGGQSPTEQSGQGKAEAGNSVRQNGNMGRVFQRLNRESQNLSQRSLNEVVKIADGPTSRNQLQALAQKIGGGVHRFEKTGVNLFPGDGTGQSGVANFYIDIDFGARRVGGGNSRVEGTLTTTTSFKYNLTDRPFGIGDENASFNFPNVPKDGSSTCADCAVADIDLGIDNKGGEIAAEAHASIRIKPSSGSVIPESQGSTIAPRIEGGSPP
jgi:hypothetical protein